MNVQGFYDSLAPFYDLIYQDWEKSIEEQGQQLRSIIDEYIDGTATTILDVSCGIGTQAIGLARQGFRITASDISQSEILRAQSEADRFGVRIDFSVSDMKLAAEHHRAEFDVVLSADNSIPHLLTDSEILAALEQFYLCTRPGGVCLITVRDYESESLESGTIRPYGVKEIGDTRYLLFQVWSVEKRIYELSLYRIEDRRSSACEVHVMRTKYYAITIPALIRLMQNTGFVSVKRLDGRFFQPVIVGRKPGV